MLTSSVTQFILFLHVIRMSRSPKFSQLLGAQWITFCQDLTQRIGLPHSLKDSVYTSKQPCRRLCRRTMFESLSRLCGLSNCIALRHGHRIAYSEACRCLWCQWPSQDQDHSGTLECFLTNLASTLWNWIETSYQLSPRSLIPSIWARGTLHGHRSWL